MRKYTKWTKEEIEKLKELINKQTSLKNISIILNKSEGSIPAKIRQIGLTEEFRKKCLSWKEEELKKLIELINNSICVSDMSKILKKSITGIRIKATQLGMLDIYKKNCRDKMKRKWTDKETEKIKEMINKSTPLEEIAKTLNRTKVTTLQRIGELKLLKEYHQKCKDYKFKKWTIEEDKKLKELVNNATGLNDMPKFINRTKTAIFHKIHSVPDLLKEYNEKCVPKNWEYHKKQVKRGKNHPSWVGDNVTYHALHDWIRRIKPKPEFCEHCKKNTPNDLANISGEYKRDINDYLWLCEPCHTKFDKRDVIVLMNLKQFKGITDIVELVKKHKEMKENPKKKNKEYQNAQQKERRKKNIEKFREDARRRYHKLKEENYEKYYEKYILPRQKKKLEAQT